jgi:hypothetical protein
MAAQTQCRPKAATTPSHSSTRGDHRREQNESARLLKHPEGMGTPTPQGEATSSEERDPFRDLAVLDELRRSTFESLGALYGLGILYGIGMTRGLVDGMRVTRRLSSTALNVPQFPGSLIPMVFTIRGGDLEARFCGAIEGCCEARLHRNAYDAAEDPICFVTAGYSTGWYSALLGRNVLVRETQCAASGSSRCHFEARPLQDWIAASDPWAQGLLPYLDFERLQIQARQHVSELEELDDASMMGGFDPMSPAVHVWGPVMVLPYSGFLDSDAAIEAIQADVGSAHIEVVVVDVTGARIDAIEASGLVQLVNELESQRIETILVGLSPSGRYYIPAGTSPGTPLHSRDISAGIALAFQVCGASRSIGEVG